MSNETAAPGQIHVLVVDDNVELADTYREVLQTFDYRVTVAGNGAQALKLVLEKDVNAILCDLSMPELEGDMFYNAIAKIRPKLSRYFIFVTGNAGNPDFDLFLKKVDCPVLYKPVSVEDLLAALKNLLGRES